MAGKRFGEGHVKIISTRLGKSGVRVSWEKEDLRAVMDASWAGERANSGGTSALNKVSLLRIMDISPCLKKR